MERSVRNISFVGSSAGVRELLQLIERVAQGDYPILILGETGTGKELVARAIHMTGPRANRPFVAVDCGALPPTLIESELFGYVRGAFTGAVRSKQGLLQAAQSGTVLLDEIGELPMDLQAKLLRALQEKEIRPVGSTRGVRIEARIIATTNRDLESAVQQRTFRGDLYYRLNVVSMRLPPLRERKSDIPLLVDHFLDRFRQPGRPPLTPSEEATRRLMAHDWPGNVRELENTIERAIVFASGPALESTDLSIGPPTAYDSFLPELASREIIPLRELEKIAILRAIVKAHGDKVLAAKMLKIGKTTIYRKLRRFQAQEGIVP